MTRISGYLRDSVDTKYKHDPLLYRVWMIIKRLNDMNGSLLRTYSI